VSVAAMAELLMVEAAVAPADSEPAANVIWPVAWLLNVDQAVVLLVDCEVVLPAPEMSD
jgi:hypothetical protein